MNLQLIRWMSWSAFGEVPEIPGLHLGQRGRLDDECFRKIERSDVLPPGVELIDIK